MTNGGRAEGYTLVEVMIVLTISLVLLATATATIIAQQNGVQFSQSLRSLDSKIQQTINEVSSGFFPNYGNFRCTLSSSAYSTTAFPQFTTTASPVEQGSNEDCIFIGKVMHFAVAGTNGEGENTYTIAGRRLYPNSSGGLRDSNSLDEAHPRAVFSPVNITEQNTLQWGLTATRIVTTDGAHDLSGIGIIADFGQTSGNDLLSGAKSLSLVAVPGSTNQIDTAVVSAISSLTEADRATAAQGIVICLQNDRGKKASITIGGEGRQLATKVDVDTLPTVCP